MGMTIINNYGMPDNCYMCDLHNYHECDLTGESIEEDYCWNGNSREKHCPLREVEAIPKDQYEVRLKADMVAMLTDMLIDVEEIESREQWCDNANDNCISRYDVEDLIQQKINKLKGEKDETDKSDK